MESSALEQAVRRLSAAQLRLSVDALSVEDENILRAEIDRLQDEVDALAPPEDED